MNERTYSTIDKTGWGDGPWQHEPDKVQWVDSVTGMACLARRHPRCGFWCGYVGVAAAHPWHGRDSDGDIEGLDVHDGISYAAACDVDAPEATGICHVPEPGEPDGLWWFGFACAYYLDFPPGAATEARAHGWTDDHEDRPLRTYRTLDFVRDECARLAGQLAHHDGTQ